MPENHWRYTHQMAQKNTLQSKMTEENKCIIICLFYPVIMSLSDIPMFCKELIKLSCDIVIITPGICFLHSFIFKPVIILVKTFIHRPVLRKPVPENNFSICYIRTINQNIKLSEPVTFCCCAVHFFQSKRSCISGSAQR